MSSLLFLNVSHPDFYWRDKVEFLQNSNIALKMFVTLITTLCYVIGTLVTTAVIFNEKFGEDPQKRSLVNQVTSYQINVNVSLG